MNATKPWLGSVAYALIPLMVFAGSIGLARAQDVEGTIPANASANTYRTGWQCDRGFRKTDGACVVVTLPESAYLTGSSYGPGWKCKHGYKQNADTCDPVLLPANAYLSAASGDRWLCDRGYRQVDEICTAINVPANGYLTGSTSGSGWTCDRGYRAVGERLRINRGACKCIPHV